MQRSDVGVGKIIIQTLHPRQSVLEGTVGVAWCNPVFPSFDRQRLGGHQKDARALYADERL